MRCAIAATTEKLWIEVRRPYTVSLRIKTKLLRFSSNEFQYWKFELWFSEIQTFLWMDRKKGRPQRRNTDREERQEVILLRDTAWWKRGTSLVISATHAGKIYPLPDECLCLCGEGEKKLTAYSCGIECRREFLGCHSLILQLSLSSARICKRLWSRGIDSEEQTPHSSLCSLAGSYDK